ncbi:MAG: anti-sigma factor [Solirubrobacterales bacterium]
MKTDSCRDWRASLGAYSLGHLSADERAGLEAHIEGCPDCQAEVESLTDVAKLLAVADPAHFGPAPKPSPELGERITATIGAERKVNRRRRQRRFGFALSGGLAATAAILAIVILPGGGGQPEQRVEFASVPRDVKIWASLEPHAFGTEIHMYVKGVRSGTLCQVFLKDQKGASVSAGTFRYRWGDDSQAVLSSALDISSTEAIEVRAGGQTFVAPVDPKTTAS